MIILNIIVNESACSSRESYSKVGTYKFAASYSAAAIPARLLRWLERTAVNLFPVVVQLVQVVALVDYAAPLWFRPAALWANRSTSYGAKADTTCKLEVAQNKCLRVVTGPTELR